MLGAIFREPGDGRSPCIWLDPKLGETLKSTVSYFDQENEVWDSGGFFQQFSDKAMYEYHVAISTSHDIT